MIDYEFLTEWNLHYLYAEEPCSLLAIVEYGMELAASSAPAANLDLPALFDLRQIELSTDTTQSIKRAIRLRKTLKENTGNNPCAYVVGSRGSFGIMRMYGIYAELEGLRKEEFTLITEDIDEAIDWLLGHLAVSDADAASIRNALSRKGASVSKVL